MTTWAQLLADIRLDTKDTGSTPKFSDGLLLLYTKDAVRDYSSFFPYYKSRETLVAANGSYTLPSDLLRIVRVEHPLNTFLEERTSLPGKRYLTTNPPTSFYVEGGQLYLNGDPLDGEELYLTYEARHPLPADENDATFVFTIPEDDEELIRLYVKAKSSERLRTNQASLDRFKMGSGNRQDNPMQPEVLGLMDEYRLKIAERLGGGAILLYRPGRRR